MRVIGNEQFFKIGLTLVLFAVPFYHFLFSRSLDLSECHFLSDTLVPYPDSSNLYSYVAYAQSFRAAAHQQKLTLFVPSTVEMLQIL